MGGRGASSLLKGASDYFFGTGASKGSPIVISKINDKSLQGIENRIRKLKHEEAFIFNENDKLVAGVMGDSNSVDFPKEWMDMDGATVTHGHPSNRYGFGGTLSLHDAETMTYTQWGELRASANGRGEYNYIMRRTPNSNNLGLRMQIIKDRASLKERLADELNRAYNDAINSGASVKTANLISAQRGTGIIQAYWREVLPQYGFEYVTPKKEYVYGR